MIFARKINQIHEFYMIFLPEKCQNFTYLIARKIFSPEFYGTRALPAPPPVSYAYSQLLNTVRRI